MSSASWRTAPRPSSAGLHSFNHTKLVLKYKPAPCGIDSNLLLLLHGLGDTADPFFSLGQRLQQTLPQTAVLSVQAPLRVPLLEEEAWMWYDSFDALGEVRLNPDPRRAMKDITHLLTYLTAPVSQGGCGWAYEHMHALGFAQGGSVLLETLIATRANAFGSAVSRRVFASSHAMPDHLRCRVRLAPTSRPCSERSAM
ncbi:hypothetical protein MGL_2561 [Malassezia globosa CBS 7966]|uniref:Phospholipase/carboxylesterase/thioesterase domain-containing protein n=1 Tax=Malassezia globosa (strain ATCC MYA-4612 / CBS 7966) TaxID=425265 RepID=A8Q4L0_MALGO|nr:uncharacterized protein MGL_2561 [Malassezia globosa CBS 7966]EDP42965.1 hypothetical protein MGL_2561 [Malassezia globosa CBS 7966]